MSQHPLSAVRLHSLIGDAMHDLPAHFIEKLERALERDGMPYPGTGTGTGQVVHLSVARQARTKEQVPAADHSAMLSAYRRLEGLGATLAILHAAPPWVLDPELMEGLLIASHELVLATAEALRAAAGDGPCTSA